MKFKQIPIVKIQAILILTKKRFQEKKIKIYLTEIILFMMMINMMKIQWGIE